GNSTNVASFTQSNGAVTAANEYVGNTGNGSLNISGGTHTISAAATNGMFVGFGAGASGSVALSANGVLKVLNGNENVGYTGAGTFTQSGGSNTAFNLVLGVNASRSGSGTHIGRGDYNTTGSTLYVTSGAHNG